MDGWEMREVISALKDINPWFGGLERYVGGLARGLAKFRLRVNATPYHSLEELYAIPAEIIPHIEESLTGSNLINFPKDLFDTTLPNAEMGDTYLSHGPYGNEEWQRLVVECIPEHFPKEVPETVARYVSDIQGLAAQTLLIQNDILSKIKATQPWKKLHETENNFFLQDWVIELYFRMHLPTNKWDPQSPNELKEFYARNNQGRQWGRHEFRRIIYSLEERKHPQVLKVCDKAYHLLQPLREAFPDK